VDSPESIVNRLGLTGIPFVNVYNGCATGASAIATAARAIAVGECGIALALGMDKHLPGAFTGNPEEYGAPAWYAEAGHFLTTKFFGMKINRYIYDHGISPEVLAKVVVKNLRNGALNDNAFRRVPLTEADVLGSRMLNYPLTQYMFCSPDEGAAAAVLCHPDVAKRYTARPVFLRASVLRSRRYGAFEVHSPSIALDAVPSPTVDASLAAFERSGVGPGDVDVIQLQDTDAGAEIIHMAENGFCKDGEQESLIRAGATEIHGKIPINTDGGLIANGEPIGASGLRQLYESVLQLRGDAGDRQVPGNPTVAYTQVYGAPGTAAVNILTT
jgi:acetyl-CoA acetyltransferase